MNNLGRMMSTGNGLRDSLLGSGYGFLNSQGGRSMPGAFFMQTNWLGDGLASNDIGYAKNPGYKSYIDDANMTSSLFHNGQGGFNFRDKFNGALGKLSGLRDNIGEGFNRFMANRRYGDVGDFYNNMEGLA